MDQTLPLQVIEEQPSEQNTLEKVTQAISRVSLMSPVFTGLNMFKDKKQIVAKRKH